MADGQDLGDAAAEVVANDHGPVPEPELSHPRGEVLRLPGDGDVPVYALPDRTPVPDHLPREVPNPINEGYHVPLEARGGRDAVQKDHGLALARLLPAHPDAAGLDEVLPHRARPPSRPR